MIKRYIFPFTAIVGQQELKRSLILNLVNPKIGGVLVCGQKGTAKSTTIRSIENLMDDIKIVDLPLNITEDRLVGSIDLEQAIKNGKRKVEDGILAKANKNILYIDEVNLLSDYIVNTILNVSGLKVNKIEREGMSIEQESDFMLIGSMNPEEGSLRSQFVDRFGLYVDIKGCRSAEERLKIIKRRLEFEKNPLDFIEKYQKEEQKLKNAILKAREKLKEIEVHDQILYIAGELAQMSNCNGHRGEIVLVETAKAIAALENRNYITVYDLKEASDLALAHRTKNSDFMKRRQKSHDGDEDIKEQNRQNQDTGGNAQQEDLEEDLSEGEGGSSANIEEVENDEIDEKPYNEGEDNKDDFQNTEKEEVFEISDIFKVKDISLKMTDKKARGGTGKRSATKTILLKGRYIKYKIPKDKVKDLALDATIRVAAPYQKQRKKGNLAIKINNEDIREKVREKRTGTSILFLVDASGSMGAQKRMSVVKGAIISLLSDAYEKRDKVGMIAFRKDKAEVLLNITRSVELAKEQLEILPTGGKTPLSLGLEKAYNLILSEMRKDKDMIPLMVVVTDGRATYSPIKGEDPFDSAINIAYQIKKKEIQSVVVDCEKGYIKMGQAKDLADALNAKYYEIDDLKQSQLTSIVKKFT